MPVCGSPTSSPTAPSKSSTQVAEPLIPILCSIDAAGDARFALPARRRSPTSSCGTMKSEMPAGADGRVGQPREHQVHDLLGHVVLAGGDEDLGAGDPVAAVAVRLGARGQQAQVGARLRLGQAHRAAPLAASPAGARSASICSCEACAQSALAAPGGQQRIGREGQVRRADDLLEADAQHLGQPAAAALRVGIATPHQPPSTIASRGRRGTRLGVVTLPSIEPAALTVADGVQRQQHRLAAARPPRRSRPARSSSVASS